MRISVNLNPEIFEALSDYADEEGLTLPAAAAEILEDSLREEESEDEGEDEE